jgi:hypothetical protein
MLNIYFLLAKRSFSDMHWDSGGRKWISYLLLEAAKSKPKQSRSVFFIFPSPPLLGGSMIVVRVAVGR